MAHCIEHDNGDEDGGNRDIPLLSSAGNWEEARCLCLPPYLLVDEEVDDKEEDEGSQTQTHRYRSGYLQLTW